MNDDGFIKANDLHVLKKIRERERNRQTEKKTRERKNNKVQAWWSFAVQ